MMILALFASAHGAFAELLKWEQDFYRAQELAKAEKKILMVHFYTNWSKWSRRFEHESYSNQRVLDRLTDHFVCVKINPEKGERNRDLSRRFGTRDYPHIVFVDENGNKMDEIRGYVTSYRFSNKLDDLIGKKRGRN
jgi:thioredoxin-related protein